MKRDARLAELLDRLDQSAHRSTRAEWARMACAWRRAGDLDAILDGARFIAVQQCHEAEAARRAAEHCNGAAALAAVQQLGVWDWCLAVVLRTAADVAGQLVTPWPAEVQ